jgi:hypothetical protein
MLCNRQMAIDRHASTKSMIRHLSRCHHIEPPVNTEQHTMTAYFIDGRMANVSYFNIILFFTFSINHIN